MSKITELLATEGKIWTLDDMSAIWGHSKRTDTSQSAKKYAAGGELRRVYRGVYARAGAELFPADVADKLVAPSYLSCESILKKHGVSFQFSERVTSVALVSRKIRLDGVEYVYYKMNDDIFYNRLGMVGGEAGLERAVGDLVYLTGGKFAFEDLSWVDWGKLAEIAEIYGKESVVRNIKRLEELHA